MRILLAITQLTSLSRQGASSPCPWRSLGFCSWAQARAGAELWHTGPSTKVFRFKLAGWLVLTPFLDKQTKHGRGKLSRPVFRVHAAGEQPVSRKSEIGKNTIKLFCICCLINIKLDLFISLYVFSVWPLALGCQWIIEQGYS